MQVRVGAPSVTGLLEVSSELGTADATVEVAVPQPPLHLMMMEKMIHLEYLCVVIMDNTPIGLNM